MLKKKKVSEENFPEEVIDFPEDPQTEIEELKRKIEVLENQKKQEEDVPEEELEVEKASTPAAIPTVPRLIYLSDSEAIRQILAEIQSLRDFIEEKFKK